MAINSRWIQHTLSNFYLQTHDTLPVVRVMDKNEKHVGFALGWLVDQNGSLVSAQLQTAFSIESASEQDLEDFVYRFGGRYAIIFLSDALQRLYLDNGGTLAAVYCPERKRAGSTVTLLLQDERGHPIFSRSASQFPGDRINHYWPAGLTPDQKTLRLLPNHYLDLRHWQAVRHYPQGPFEPITEHDIPFHLERIVQTIQRNIQAVLKQVPITYINLSAGQDTRILLACARDFTERIDFVTFDYRTHDNYQDHFADLHISKRLAKQFGLRQHILPVKNTVEQDVIDQYMLRTGYAGHPGKAKDFFQACRTYLDLSGALLSGFDGARPLSLQEHNFQPDQDSAAFLLKVQRLPTRPLFIEAVSSWLSQLPDRSPETVLRLAHLEMRLGCWASAHLYGAASMAINLIPFRHRDVSDARLRLPLDYISNEAFAKDIIELTWPELLKLPINNYTGPKGWYRSARRQVGALGRRLGLLSQSR